MKVKFLIIRFSSIGDIVLTTPVIRCLKQQVEGAEVHFATKKEYASLVSSNPYVDKVHLLEGTLNDLIRKLKEEHFDYIIDLHHNIRSYIIKTRLRLITFAFNKINFQKWLLVYLKIKKLPQKHIVDRYLETCYLFDIVNDNKGLDFFIAAENEVDIKTFPEAFVNEYVAIAIGAKHNTKKMPVELLAEVCSKIKRPIILLGGKEDIENASLIISLSGKSEIMNTCGAYNLQQAASVVRQAKLVVTHDTGLMHIAAAFKKKIISIWGNTIPEFGMYPYMPGHEHYMFEVKGLRCRPCSKLGYSKCPKKHFNCMELQPLNDIVDLCNKI
jgi:ADP-heptose:LPS heptosyltransferase